MIRYPRVLIPQFSSSENHGLLIYFLEEYYDKSEDSQEFLERIIIVYCEKCNVRDISTEYDMLCDCVKPRDVHDDISYENASEYVSESSLEIFKSYHPRDQFTYIEKVYYEYADYWPMSRRSHNEFIFCYGCNTTRISTDTLDDDIYRCRERGCTTTYCQNCVDRNILEYLSSSFGKYQWFHDCKCRKHTTLFQALYTILFIEK